MIHKSNKMSTFAWFTATTSASVTSNNTGALQTTGKSDVTDYAITVGLTWTGLDTNPVQVDASGHEKVYIAAGTSNLRDLDSATSERTARSSVVRYYMVGVSVTSVITSFDAELAAARYLGHSATMMIDTYGHSEKEATDAVIKRLEKEEEKLFGF